jgi:uncharacterized metal-binding protein
MSDLNLYIKLSMLPNFLKAELSEYMDYLISKKLKKKDSIEKKPKAGFLKGTFFMSPDFDEPLDDFKEYME